MINASDLNVISRKYNYVDAHVRIFKWFLNVKGWNASNKETAKQSFYQGYFE